MGGVSNLPSLLSHAGDVTTSGFVGCLRDVRLGGRDLLVTGDVSGLSRSANLTRDSCALRRVVGQCAEHPCDNGAQCIDEWIGYRCQCPDGFAGPTCNTGLFSSSQFCRPAADDLLVFCFIL